MRTAGTTCRCTGLTALLADAVYFWMRGMVVLHMQHALPEPSVATARQREVGAMQGQNTAKTKPTRKYKKQNKKTRDILELS